VPTQGFPMQPRLIAFGNPRRTSIAAKAASASKMKATQIMIIELRRRLAFATGRLCSCRRHRRSDHQRRHRGGDSLGRSRVFQKGLRPTSEPERQAQRNDQHLAHRTIPLRIVGAHGRVRDLLRAEGIGEKVGGLERLVTLDDLLGSVGR
jgi:hypothetical protein